MPSFMRQRVSDDGDSLRRGRQFYSPALLTVMGLYVCLLTVTASAENVQGIPDQPIPLNAGNGFSGVRYVVSGSATASSHTTPIVAAADGFGESLTEFGNAAGSGFGEDPELGPALFSAIATTPDSQAIALSDVQAQLGSLGASATANITNTATAAQARAVVTWADYLAVEDSGEGLLSSFKVTPVLLGSLSAIAGAGTATVHAQLWIFPDTGTFPQQFAPINAQFYQEIYREASGFTLNTTIGSLFDLTPGAPFWAYSRLAVFASVGGLSGGQPNFPDLMQHSASSFSSTFNVFIDPSPETPGARMTSLSGHDYRTPVPEPSGLVLALGVWLVGFAGSGARRRP